MSDRNDDALDEDDDDDEPLWFEMEPGDWAPVEVNDDAD